MIALLSPKDELARVRVKFPGGLFCTSPLPCEHRVIASGPIGWSKSWPDLTGAARAAARDSFVCAGCTQAAAARAQATESRRASLSLARAAVAGRRGAVVAPEAADAPLYGLRPEPSEGDSDTRGNVDEKDRGFNYSATAPAKGPHSRRPEAQGVHGSKGGRPRKHTSTRATNAAAQRAHRARVKQARVAANDAAVAEVLA